MFLFCLLLRCLKKCGVLLPLTGGITTKQQHFRYYVLLYFKFDFGISFMVEPTSIFQCNFSLSILVVQYEQGSYALCSVKVGVTPVFQVVFPSLCC